MWGRQRENKEVVHGRKRQGKGKGNPSTECVCRHVQARHKAGKASYTGRGAMWYNGRTTATKGKGKGKEGW